MDSIELVWKSYFYSKEKEEDDDEIVERRIARIKSSSQSLKTFIQEVTDSTDSYLSLEYKINDVFLEQWWAENIVHCISFFEEAAEVFTLYLNPWGDKKIYTPGLKLQLHKMLGKQISLGNLSEFGYDLKSREKKDWDFFLEEENFDVQLYGCTACLDRLCGYIPLFIKREEENITWTFKGKRFDVERDYSFTFNYQAYLNEFEALIDYIKTTF
jgi:hypothetical protein